MQTKTQRFLENFIVLAIILVLIQTFLEDFAILAGWSWDIRKILIVSGFAFDLIFTAEFFTRSIYAASTGSFHQYFTRKRGWIDFLASVPLLLFNSGPELFALLTGSGAILAFGGLLNILKVVKAIRIARVLRLLRVLKIFRRIKNTESTMAQRHVTRIATMVVTTLVMVLLVLAVVESSITIPNVDDVYRDSIGSAMDYVQSHDSAEITAYVSSIPTILELRNDGHVVYESAASAEAVLAPSDYGYVSAGVWEMYIDIRALNAEDAVVNLRYFFLIISLVLMLMFLYSPHFALTISDPIHVMRKGFDEAGYSLEVRIPEEFAGDEVYRLAASYNSAYLPLKDRESHESQSSVLNLSLDDFADLSQGLDSGAPGTERFSLDFPEEADPSGDEDMFAEDFSSDLGDEMSEDFESELDADLPSDDIDIDFPDESSLDSDSDLDLDMDDFSFDDEDSEKR